MRNFDPKFHCSSNSALCNDIVTADQGSQRMALVQQVLRHCLGLCDAVARLYGPSVGNLDTRVPDNRCSSLQATPGTVIFGGRRKDEANPPVAQRQNVFRRDPPCLAIVRANAGDP